MTIVEITKNEYGVLYLIARNGRTDFKRLGIGLERAKSIVLELEKKGLVKINYRDGEIYGFIETPLGEKTLADKKYEKWFLEFGD